MKIHAVTLALVGLAAILPHQVFSMPSDTTFNCAAAGTDGAFAERTSIGLDLSDTGELSLTVDPDKLPVEFILAEKAGNPPTSWIGRFLADDAQHDTDYRIFFPKNGVTTSLQAIMVEKAFFGPADPLETKDLGKPYSINPARASIRILADGELMIDAKYDCVPVHAAAPAQ